MSLQSRPLVVMLHGGYWRPQHGPEHLAALATALRLEGFEVETPEYQRAPGDPYLTLKSVNSILGNYASREVILVGFSAGGQFALLTANNFANIKAILCISPVTDLLKTEELGLGDGATQEWLPQSAANYPDLDPKISAKPTAPTIILHGDQDSRVPIDLSIDYVQAAKAAGANIELISIKSVGHFEIIDPSATSYTEILKALIKLSEKIN